MFKRHLFSIVLLCFCFSCLQAQSNKQSLKFILAPEIKSSTDSSLVLVWQTSQPTSAQIVIYTSSERKIIDINDVSDRHEIIINQLLPETAYLYRIIASSGSIGIVTPLKIAQTAPKIIAHTNEQ